MLAQNIPLERSSASLDKPEAERAEKRAEPDLVVLDARINTRPIAEEGDRPPRLSRRQSMAVIAGLSAVLWLVIALLIF